MTSEQTPCPCVDGLPDPCPLCLAPADGICGRSGDGRFLVGEGQAVIDGKVVTLREVRGRGGSVQPIAYRRGRWVLGNESDAWMDQRTAFVIGEASDG